MTLSVWEGFPLTQARAGGGRWVQAQVGQCAAESSLSSSHSSAMVGQQLRSSGQGMGMVGLGGADLPGLLKVCQDVSQILQFYSIIVKNVLQEEAPWFALPAVEMWLLDDS